MGKREHNSKTMKQDGHKSLILLIFESVAKFLLSKNLIAIEIYPCIKMISFLIY